MELGLESMNSDSVLEKNFVKLGWERVYYDNVFERNFRDLGLKSVDSDDFVPVCTPEDRPLAPSLWFETSRLAKTIL